MTKKKKNYKRFGWLIYLIVFVIILIILSFGDRGFIKQFQAYKKQSALKTQIKEMNAEKELLKQQAEQLDQPETIEKVAREEYGMAKEGEEVYKVIPKEE